MSDDVETTPASGELVVPGTGEVVDLADEVSVARALKGLRDFSAMVRAADGILTSALIERSRVLGTKTLNVAGLKAVVSSGIETVYDAEAIEADLREAGMPDTQIREIVKEVITHKVDARRAKSAAGANADYKEIIDRHTTKFEKRQSVSVDRT